MSRFARRSLGRLILVAALTIAVTEALLSAQPVSRLLVYKRPQAAADQRIEWVRIPEEIPLGRGFAAIADYASQQLFEGPAEAAAALEQDLMDAGYEVDQTTDLDFVAFHGYTLDPDTGATEPALPADSRSERSSAGPEAKMFIVVLKGLPTDGWIADIEARGIAIVEALPPVAYVVQGDEPTVLGLPASTRFTRGAFRIDPALKLLAFPPAPSESIHRRISIQAVESRGSESLLPYLESVAVGPVERNILDDDRVLYEADITELDAAVVSRFENVYAVEAAGEVRPSGEREGVLVLQPSWDSSRMILGNNPNYAAILISKGVTDFNNTKIGLLDTGFDDGTNTHPDFQAGGPQVTVLKEPAFATAADRYTHGTLTASVAVGYSPIGSDRKDAQGFRFALGLAESCKLVSDKILECSGPGASLVTALDQRMAPQNVNVISISINDTSQCAYTSNSAVLDIRTRSKNWLFTVSAGNNPGGACDSVQSPATAKNAIAAGATNNYTPQGWINCPAPPAPDGTCGPTRANTCPWNNTQLFASQNARNIPNFTAYRDKDSMVKPDLVAPAVRVTGPVSRATAGTWCSGHGVFCNENIVTKEGVTYGFSAGTSFAAPAVAGAAAVVRKWYNVALKPGSNPSPAMTKAILINGARDLGGEPGISAAQILPASFSPPDDTIEHVLAPAGPPGYLDYQGWGC